MYKDAMETAFASGNAELAEGLLCFFVDTDNKECFAACLYTCYDLIRPDVALELAWRKGMTDFVMPFMVQTLHDQSNRLDTLERKTQKREEAGEKDKSAPNDYVPDCVVPAMMGPGLPGFGHLAITGPSVMQACYNAA